nr:hypothetical protein Cbor_1 [Cedratvirus borely]
MLLRRREQVCLRGKRDSGTKDTICSSTSLGTSSKEDMIFSGTWMRDMIFSGTSLGKSSMKDMTMGAAKIS